MRMQSNTSKELKTLMEKLKRISRLKIQSNTSKEGKNLLKRLDETTKKKIQAENTKQHQERRKNSNMERRKAFKKVQGMSMVDPIIFDAASYRII